MKVKQSTILQALKKDYESSKTLRKLNDADIFRRRRIYNGEPYGNEQAGKSKIVSKVARKQEEWIHASLKEPFVSTDKIVRFIPITEEDTQAAFQNEILLNYQFCRLFPRYNFITKALKVLEVDATVFIQVGWEYEDEVIEEEITVQSVDPITGQIITDKQIVEKIKVLKNRPTAKVCRSEDIFVDPTCQDDLDKAQFIIYRYETDLSSLRKDGRYKNLDKLMTSSIFTDGDYYPADETYFQFNDEPRKKFIVHEYWGNYDINGDGIAEPIVCSWVDNTIIRLEENPYPDKKPPFIHCPATPIPFKIYGENNIDLIEDQQKVTTAITRGIIDNMAASTNGQIGIRKGALDPVQKERMLKGQNFEFNTSPADIWQGSYNNIPSSAFSMLQLMNNEVEALTGVRSFNGGTTASDLGGTATAVRSILDATAIRRMDKVRNIAENLIKPLIRKWMVYNSAFLEDEEIVRITNGKFVPVRRDDLEGKVDLSIEVSTPENDAARKQELSFMLQTLGNTLPFDITKRILAEFARLNKMPKLEKDILEFTPQPNQLEEQLKQLQIEKEKALIAESKARTREIYSRAVENKEGDLVEKMAKAKLLNSQAELLQSKKDIEDLKFLKTNNQEDEKFQLEKLKLEQEFKEKLAALQAAYGDTNIGVTG